MSEARIEYGIRRVSGMITWPDDDGELLIGGDYIDAEEAPLHRPGLEPGERIVQRTVTYSEPEEVPVTLPTTPGSLVRATVRRALDSARSIVALTSDGDSIPWRVLTSVDGDYVCAADLSDVEILFDAGA